MRFALVAKVKAQQRHHLPMRLAPRRQIEHGLARKRTVQSVADLREACEAQIKALGAELEERGWPPDAIEDARYAQCALLDETALRDLEDERRDEWERQPLQLSEFASNDAGEELVRRIEKRLRDSQPASPLLAIFGAVLDLGFTGQLALDGGGAKTRLRQAIDARLGVTPVSDDDGSVVVKAAVTRSWTLRVSPLAWIALACVAVGAVWFGINGWLDASVVRMTH